jgi:hypothetical protein
MRGEIKRIHHSLGLTTIYVTHDQEEALSMADRLVVLRSGLVQQVGTPLELHGKPANWFVADFMGCRNLLDMTADAAARPGERIQVSGGRLTFVGEAVNSLAAGEAVKVAIRPEDLSIRDGDAQPGDIAAVVSTTEYVGREYSVNADAGDHVLHARSRVDHAPDTLVQLYADRSVCSSTGRPRPGDRAPRCRTATAATATTVAGPRQHGSRTDRAERGVDGSLWLLVPALVITLGLFFYPFVYGIGLTFQPYLATQKQYGGGALANYVGFFTDRFFFDSVWLTMRLGLPVALFNVLAAVPVAFKTRREFRGKRTMMTLLVLPSPWARC